MTRIVTRMEMQLIQGSNYNPFSSNKICIVDLYFSVENIVYFSYQKSYESRVSII